ncbi:hypothetical protein [Aurantiacibacter sp. D1-12]|uniref:hypothetical protein n=1 Tax=Aurantiacibacter sp. D1-12 TaxID=2993658 RepID=UPI00237D0E38|nr:hypothetical protein [Aurantiacibacter sp. D1-12]MDE1467681.1 hypothetical protein [Aurantiacibacter sp. D1-12]
MIAGNSNRWRGVATYAPLFLGVAMLIYFRSEGSLHGSDLVSAALLLIASSCLIYSFLPGAGELPTQQTIMLSNAGIDYHPWMGRLANGLVGALLCVAALVIWYV